MIETDKKLQCVVKTNKNYCARAREQSIVVMKQPKSVTAMVCMLIYDLTNVNISANNRTIFFLFYFFMSAYLWLVNDY